LQLKIVFIPLFLLDAFTIYIPAVKPHYTIVIMDN